MSRVVATSEDGENGAPVIIKSGNTVIATRSSGRDQEVVSQGLDGVPRVVRAGDQFSGTTLVGGSSEKSVFVPAPQQDRQVLQAGVVGRRGQQGYSEGTVFDRIAGEVVSALRAVYEVDGVVFYLDPDDNEHIDLMLGVTISAAQEGDSVRVQRIGVIDDNSWNWSPGRIWLGPHGSLTQTPPSGRFDMLIGSALSAKRIVLNIQDSILLEE